MASMTNKLHCDICDTTTSNAFGERGWWEMKQMGVMSMVCKHICSTCYDYLSKRKATA